MSIPISLTDLGQYCRDMAEAADVTGIPKPERDLWAQIAAEVDDYLHPANQDALFHPTETDQP
jgi:hypothetical protein